MEQRPVTLTVGGSDSCAGAGIQADLRVFEALEVQGCSAISALTAQNPETISHIQPSSIEQFTAEINTLADYYDIQSIKTGMLYDEAHLNALVKLIKQQLPNAALVVDPVLIASSGKHLFLGEQTASAYKHLIELATIWTPNLQEAAFFLGHDIHDPVETISELLLLCKTPVLLKGGHGNGEILQDIFCDLDGTITFFEHPRQDLPTLRTHGTGCRLAAAIAANLAYKNELITAVVEAQHWLQADL